LDSIAVCRLLCVSNKQRGGKKKKRRNKERRASQKEVRSARQMADIASSARHPLLSSPVADVLLIDFNHETKTNEGG
jgi:hypothetical protein